MALCFSGAAAAQTFEQIVAQGETLVRAGKYAEAFDLLSPLEDRFAGDLKFDYLLARSALEIGQPSRASFIYERILAVEPNYVGVRLEMGRAYLALGDYARAKLEFETVLRFENLPADLRQQAQVYGNAADQYLAGKKTVGIGYLEYGAGHDSNPQSITTAVSVPLSGGGSFPITVPPEADTYQALNLGGELIHALDGGYSVFAGGDLRTRYYSDLEVANYQLADLRTGLGYTSGPHNVRVAITAGRFWLDKEKTRDATGGSLDYRYLAGKQDQITLGLSGSHNRYLPAGLTINNYDSIQLALGWVHGSADGRTVFGTTLIGGEERENNGRVDGDKPFVGLRFTFQHSLGAELGFFAAGGAQQGKYRTLNPVFTEKREENFYDLALGLSWSVAKGWSLRAQVVRLENSSNISLYEFRRTDASLNLRWDF